MDFEKNHAFMMNYLKYVMSSRVPAGTRGIIRIKVNGKVLSEKKFVVKKLGAPFRSGSRRVQCIPINKRNN